MKAKRLMAYAILWIAHTFAASQVLACSETSDCGVVDGTYRIMETRNATGTLIFAHGYKGSAGQTMRGRLKAFAQDQGLNLVALQSAGDDWAIPNAPTDGNFVARDEIAYVKAVFEDLETRLDLDRSRTVFAGFSAGAMLVSTVACQSELSLYAFVAIAGTAWAPLPKTCTQNATPFLHIHGRNDKTVPIAGRQVANAHQGHVRQFLNILAADRDAEAETLAVKSTACTDPELISVPSVVLCLTMDRHQFRPEFLQIFSPTKGTDFSR